MRNLQAKSSKRKLKQSQRAQLHHSLQTAKRYIEFISLWSFHSHLTAPPCFEACCRGSLAEGHHCYAQRAAQGLCRHCCPPGNAAERCRAKQPCTVSSFAARVGAACGGQPSISCMFGSDWGVCVTHRLLHTDSARLCAQVWSYCSRQLVFDQTAWTRASFGYIATKHPDGPVCCDIQLEPA